MKNATGILIGSALNLYMTLGSIDSLTILILPVHEHRISFHLFVSSSISFISVLHFSVYRAFISLVKFIPEFWCVFLRFILLFIYLTYCWLCWVLVAAHGIFVEACEIFCCSVQARRSL